MGAWQADLTKLRVGELKKILAEKNIPCDGCIEKEDFVKRLKESLGKGGEL